AVPLAPAGKATREGAPSQKTSARRRPEPLAEGGFVFRLPLVVLAALAALLVPPAGAFAAVPHRIVSLSPTATESLFAIGAGKQVVAVDNQSDYPKRAPRTSLSGFTPNVEAIASYHPDLVVLQYDAGGVVEGLHKLNIRVLVQPSAKNL